MPNLRKLIEDRFASSVKDRVKLFWTTYRSTCSCCERTRAAIRIDGREAFRMHDFIYCNEITYYPEPLKVQELAERDIVADWQFKSSLWSYSNLAVPDILAS